MVVSFGNKKRVIKLAKLRGVYINDEDQLCETCRTKYAEHIHHINQDRNNNTDENLTLICRNCHRLLHIMLNHVQFLKRIEEGKQFPIVEPFYFQSAKPK